MSGEPRRVGLVAGNGKFPVLFSRAAGARDMVVYAAAHVGETDPDRNVVNDENLWGVLKMKNLIKCLTFVPAVLMLFVLAGCSSINTTKEITMAGRSISHLSARSNSVWISRITLREPAVQGGQRYALQNNEMLDIESIMKSQLNERETKRSDGLNVSSHRHHTVTVVDALMEVFSGGNTTKEPVLKEATVEVGNGYNIVAVVF